MTRRVRKKANLTNVLEPDLVTLTKKPANRSGFKIMRSAESGANVEEEVQRAESYLISIDLPDEATEEDAQAVLEGFGLDDSYHVESANGHFSIRRNEGDEVENCVSIPLAGGKTARVAPAAFQRSEDLEIKAADHKWPDGDAKSAIRLVSLRFDPEQFTTATAVDAWLKENGIDYPANGVQQSENAFVVTRSEADDDTCEVTFAGGVTGIICRADELDYPYALYGQTVEQAYGQWGWGQLDFNAYMADVAFTDKSGDAIWRLRDVLDRIVLESQLPLDTRKQLIVNAVSSYAVYQIGLIDALPRAVIEQTRSDDQPTGQENTMSKKEQESATDASVDTKVERTEAEVVTEEQAADEAPAAETPEFVTRGELEEIVAGAVAKALEPKTEETAEVVERSEEAPSEEAPVDKLDTILGAIGELAGVVKTQGETIVSMRSELEEIEGSTTVARSSVEPEVTEVDRSELTPADPGFWAGSVVGRK